jgi:hypothetical protein
MEFDNLSSENRICLAEIFYKKENGIYDFFIYKTVKLSDKF